jgi:D-alanyl-D-alanine carboxypeptidase/D-alanyl-D-alanine-endopeptidase (penicillin-binding protein 4)
MIDDRLFAPAAATGSGPRLVSPVVVNDNVLDLTVTPAGKAGDPASVRVRPATAYYRIDARVETVAAAQRVPRVRVDVVSPGFLRVSGQVPVGHGPALRTHPVEDPAGFARALFIEALRAEGVDVKAELRALKKAVLPPPEEVAALPRVAVYTSPPLRELLKVTLKVSHNLYASSLPLLLAADRGRRTQADGMALQGAELARLGVDVAGISLESGAGGGDADKVSPRATVQLLTALRGRASAPRPDEWRGPAAGLLTARGWPGVLSAAPPLAVLATRALLAERRRADYEAFRAALPVLGVDGTLADAVGPDSPARGKVRAKTGTYTDRDLLNQRVLLRSKALAGYLTTASGRELVVCFFVNDVFLEPGHDAAAEGRVLARLCEAVYRSVP